MSPYMREICHRRVLKQLARHEKWCSKIVGCGATSESDQHLVWKNVPSTSSRRQRQYCCSCFPVLDHLCDVWFRKKSATATRSPQQVAPTTEKLPSTNATGVILVRATNFCTEKLDICESQAHEPPPSIQKGAVSAREVWGDAREASCVPLSPQTAHSWPLQQILLQLLLLPREELRVPRSTSQQAPPQSSSLSSHDGRRVDAIA